MRVKWWREAVVGNGGVGLGINKVWGTRLLGSLSIFGLVTPLQSRVSWLHPDSYCHPTDWVLWSGFPLTWRVTLSLFFLISSLRFQEVIQAYL